MLVMTKYVVKAAVSLLVITIQEFRGFCHSRNSRIV